MIADNNKRGKDDCFVFEAKKWYTVDSA